MQDRPWVGARGDLGATRDVHREAARDRGQSVVGLARRRRRAQRAELWKKSSTIAACWCSQTTGVHDDPEPPAMQKQVRVVVQGSAGSLAIPAAFIVACVACIVTSRALRAWPSGQAVLECGPGRCSTVRQLGTCGWTFEPHSVDGVSQRRLDFVHCSGPVVTVHITQAQKAHPHSGMHREVCVRWERAPAAPCLRKLKLRNPQLELRKLELSF